MNQINYHILSITQIKLFYKLMNMQKTNSTKSLLNFIIKIFYIFDQ